MKVDVFDYYFQAIDVWMSTCLVFVFSALLEYSFVNVLARKQLNAVQVKKAVDAFKSALPAKSMSQTEVQEKEEKVRKNHEWTDI